MSTAEEAAAFAKKWHGNVARELEANLAIHLPDPLADAIYHAILRTQWHYIDIRSDEYADLASDIATEMQRVHPIEPCATKPEVAIEAET